MDTLPALDGCQPERFFTWFQKICTIPHTSYHEGRLCDFLAAFAEERGLSCYRDNMDNLLIRVPASEGYDHVPPFLLQSHMDMVPAADEGVEFDFLRDPIRLQVIGNELHATGTTLGADDAGGIAAMLAFVDDPTVKHPDLELLFTVQEEVGMNGIRQFDFSQIRSRRMINFDSGRTHRFCVSSAGAANYVIETDLPLSPTDGDSLQIQIRDGLGGHAGLDIHKNRACAVNVLGELLWHLQQQMPVRLITVMSGGSSIFPRCDAQIAVPPGKGDEARRILLHFFAVQKQRFVLTDPDLRCGIEPTDRCPAALSEADSSRVIRLLFLLPTGLRKCDAADPTIVLGSGSVMKAELTDGHLAYKYAVRAVEDNVRDQYGAMCEALLQLLGFRWSIGTCYGGWPMQHGSELVALFDRKHQALFGYPADHQFVHGGIEVGFIVSAIPDMDAIAINLPMANAHTTNELIYIDQVPDFWALFTTVFAER